METRNPFRVPDNYFEEVKQEIINNLPPKNKYNKLPFYKNALLKWSAIASVILLFITISFNYLENHNKSYINKTHNLEVARDANQIVNDQQYANLQNDFFLFVEDQATLLTYKDDLGFDDF